MSGSAMRLEGGATNGLAAILRDAAQSALLLRMRKASVARIAQRHPGLETPPAYFASFINGRAYGGTLLHPDHGSLPPN
jgi:hypothetical protein